MKFMYLLALYYVHTQSDRNFAMIYLKFKQKRSQMSLVVRKPDFCICENKDADQLRGNCEADHAFVFAIRMVQFLFYLNTKFQASSHLLSLCSLVCVGPGRKPRRLAFSERGSNHWVIPLDKGAEGIANTKD